MTNELQQKLNDLYELKEQLIKNQETVNHALTLTEKTIKEVECSILQDTIQNSVEQRFNMKSSDALIEFGISSNLFTKDTPSEDIKTILFEFLKTQSILNYYLLYKKEGVDMINELVNSIYNIE